MATSDWLTTQLAALGISNASATTFTRPDKRTMVRITGQRGEEMISEEYLAIGNWRADAASKLKAKYGGRVR